MAFPASVIITSDAFDFIRRQAVATKQYLQAQRALMVAQSVDSLVPIAVIQHFGQAIALLDVQAAAPGLAAYAQQQVNNPSLDIVAEYNAMRSAMVAARDNLIGMFPKDGSGFLLYQTLNADGSISRRIFTAAQVAPAVTLMDNVIATIA